MARDVVRAVQQARREAGLEVSDRIALVVGGSTSVQESVVLHADLIKTETLAADLTVGDVVGGPTVALGDGQKVTVSVSRAAA
ncbi:MAG: DUF5915 domain-containing protein [Microlunatus sp.]|nr:DUF5915 domain-containing protein [Microlunatus sp.]